MNFNVVIPARYESTRLPGKPLIEIAGIPMVIRTAIQASKSGASHVIIATDDIRIKNIAEKHNFKALMTDKSHTSGTDRVLDAANQKGWLSNEIIINVQGDEPLLTPEMIKATISPMIELEEVDGTILSIDIIHEKQYYDENVLKKSFLKI